ncbi:hypothetical protein QEL93_004613 [Pseudomonas putida]|nr:hypothetical protein [Pseudomonas putida]
MPIASKKLQQSGSEGVLADAGQALNTAGQPPYEKGFECCASIRFIALNPHLISINFSVPAF